MSMKNKDYIAEQKTKLMNNLSQAMKSGDEGAMALAFTEFADAVQQSVISEAQAVMQASDTGVLTARGTRQLTSAENKFYQAVIGAMSSSNPRQALTDLELAMPETVIESVFEDIRTAHPLLEAITFVNTQGAVKMIVNKTGMQLAAWGKLGSAITKELEGSIGVIDTTLCKLTAFLPVSKDMLELGPVWLDRYVREILSEAIALSTESAIVDGDGKDKPIGMTRSVAEDVTVTAGVYPHKQSVAVTEITPTSYGELLSKLTTAPNGKKRTVDEVIFVVNPTDYLKKVMPCTTVRAADGGYKTGVFPFPTRVIQTAGIKEGKAVIGLPKRYFLGIGSQKNGKIEYSDEYQFLEDNRVYIAKLFANGMPLDDNAFIYVDISNLKPQDLRVEVTNTPEKPVNTKSVQA